MEWLTVILPFVQPLLLKCLDNVSSEDPVDILRENYDSVNQCFYPDFVHDAMPHTLRGMTRARRSLPKSKAEQFPKFSRTERYQLTEKILHESMNATPEQVSAVRGVAAELG